jgi:uncharacterized Ntn-hydrolase superfamily protein
MTYSIVARDPQTGELGVAVQSRAFGTAVACAWARAGVGAVATQSFTERGYGPRGLDLLEAGRAPADALAELVAADDRRDFRQVAFVNAHGSTAAHTGAACVPDAGDLARDGAAAQGNMLASPDVVPALLEGFFGARGPLAERLLAALDAAEAAGGDFRGRQSAGMLVVGAERKEGPWDGVVVDVRVEDDPDPLPELRRVYRLAYAVEHRDGMDAATARAFGLPEDVVAVGEAVRAAKAGDLDAAAAFLAPYARADARWRDAYERYERLGILPQGVVERL